MHPTATFTTAGHPARTTPESMTTPLTPAASDAAPPAVAGKYITFLLGDESYGVSVLKVREIIRHIAVTAMPQMPGYVKGVINLRGKVVPIVDLRLKFRLEHADVADRTCIVVVQVALSGGSSATMGLIVDAVQSVANITANDIEPTPDFGGQIGTEYLLAMAKLEHRVVALLDIDRAVAAEEAHPAARQGAHSPATTHRSNHNA
jgi:purine-binding chemotaxis protein CheW